MEVQGMMMNKEDIERLKMRHKETMLLIADCPLASIDLNSLDHLRPLVWHIFHSLRVLFPCFGVFCDLRNVIAQPACDMVCGGINSPWR